MEAASHDGPNASKLRCNFTIVTITPEVGIQVGAAQVVSLTVTLADLTSRLSSNNLYEAIIIPPVTNRRTGSG